MFFRFLALFSIFLASLLNPVVTRGATISGTLAFDGSSTPDSFVNIWNDSGEHVAWLGNHGDGTWMSEDLPAGTYYATARGEDFGFVSELHDGLACPWEACDVTQGAPIELIGTDVTGIAFDLAPEERLWRLRGTVFDSGGQPVGGGVRLFNVLGWHMYEMWIDHEGNFESDLLPDGTYFAATVFTWGMMDEAWEDVPCINMLCDLVGEATAITVTGGDVGGLDFVLDPITSGGHIGGQVTGPDGPLAHIWLEIRNANGEAMDGMPTDANGYYQTGLLPDETYFVNTHNEPFGLGRELWDNVSCNPPWICGDPVFVRDHGTGIELTGSDRLDIDFELAVPHGGMISGQLIDSDTSLPVPGAWMVLINAETHEFLWGVSADGNGMYYFSGLATGNYKVLAEGVPEGYAPELYGGDYWPCDLASCGDVIAIPEASTEALGMDLHLEFEGTRIVGRITRSDTNEPVDGHQAWIGIDLFNANGDHLGFWHANEVGLYDIRLEGEGDYYLAVMNDIDQHRLINEVWDDIPCLWDCYPLNVPGAGLLTVLEGESHVLHFELDPGLTISGTLAFEGTATAESFVNIWGSDGSLVAGAGNDGSGNWMSHPLPPGTYYATAWGEDFGMVSELYNNKACPWEACDVKQGTPIVLADTDVQDIDFDLSPEDRSWRLHGSVLNVAGHPVGGGVRLYNALGWHLQDMWTDHLGNVQSEHLANGSYFAVTFHTHEMLDEAWNDIPCANQVCDLLQDATPIIVDDGDVRGLNFVLEPVTAGGHISGQIRGPEGPLAFAELEIRNANGDHLFGLGTDADGNYRTHLLANGTFFVNTQNEPYGLSRELWDDILCDPFWLCWDPQWIRDHGTPVEIEGGDRTNIDFDLVLPAGGKITGQLIDPGTGLPVMGGWIVLINADTGEFLWGTGANGNGEFYFTGLDAGNYKVLAEWLPEGYTPELYGGDQWPCDLAGCGAVVNVADGTTVVPGTNIYPDFAGTRIVGRITRGDTGEPVNGFQAWVGIDLFNENGDHLGFWHANEAGLYDIQFAGSGEYYLLAVNDIEQHHLVNEVWNDIPCLLDCYPLNLPGADLVTVAEGESMVANFELSPRIPPDIERRAVIHPTAMIGDFSVIEENVVVNEHAFLGLGVQVIKNVEIGAHCFIGNFVQIGQNTVLGSECSVGDFTFIDKGVVTGARVHIGHDSRIGKDVRIGDDVHIGANVELGKSVVVWPGVCIPDHVVIPKDGVVDTGMCH